MKIYFTILSIMTSIIHVWTIYTNDSIIDMSKICIENLHRSVFLPYTMGTADAFVIIVSNKHNLRNCTIVFQKDVLDENIMKIIVIETLNKKKQSNICISSNIYLKDNGNNINLCDKLEIEQSKKPFVYKTYHSLELKIEDVANDVFHATKITATASRQLKNDEACNSFNEIRCGYHNNHSCISRELLCDQNINCGNYNLFDESEHICNKTENNKLWALLVMSSLMGIFIIYTVLHLMLKCFPKCKYHFGKHNKNEKNTMVLTTQYLPAVKTYIPVKQVETLHLRPSAIESTSKSSVAEEETKPDSKLFKYSGYKGKDDLYHKRKLFKK